MYLCQSPVAGRIVHLDLELMVASSQFIPRERKKSGQGCLSGAQLLPSFLCSLELHIGER